MYLNKKESNGEGRDVRIGETYSDNSVNMMARSVFDSSSTRYAADFQVGASRDVSSK